MHPRASSRSHHFHNQQSLLRARKKRGGKRIWSADAYLKAYPQISRRPTPSKGVVSDSCKTQQPPNMKLLNQTQKGGTVWHLQSICMWTGLACWGWLKQSRSNLGAHAPERSPRRPSLGRLQQSPTKGKPIPSEAGENSARTTCQEPGICSSPGMSTPRSGSVSPSWGGEHPLPLRVAVPQAAGLPRSTKPLGTGRGGWGIAQRLWLGVERCLWCQRCSAGRRCSEHSERTRSDLLATRRQAWAYCCGRGTPAANTH